VFENTLLNPAFLYSGHNVSQVMCYLGLSLFLVVAGLKQQAKQAFLVYAPIKNNMTLGA
jgi:hypothetical protein